MAGQYDYTIVIPARHASSRFPGKPLHPLNGRPMILHALDRARESRASRVVVATDDERIVGVCRTAGADVELTRADHPSGTDRIAEVATRRGWPETTLVVGLQGDEPATPPARLDALAANLRRHAEADMATFCTPITRERDRLDPMRVKVVRDAADMALYFSRAPIPWRRDARDDGTFPDAFLHVGLYAYRCGYLLRYGALAASAAEREEQLEQLRVLHHGGRIHVGLVAAGAAHGVDVPGDVASAERALDALADERRTTERSGPSPTPRSRATGGDAGIRERRVNESDGSGNGDAGRGREWRLESRETLHDGFYRMDRVRFRHALHGGGQSPSIERELFVRGDVVGVLPWDPANGLVLLVQQFRIGAMRQSPDPWLWEIVAGMIDGDETPLEVARREAREEAGLEFDRLEPISRYLASPGASTEEVHLFAGECDLGAAGGLHGLADEDEDILARVFPVERAIEMLDTGEVRNALSIIALQWLRHRRTSGGPPG